MNYRKTITSFAGLRASSAASGDFIIEHSKSEHALNLVGIDSPGLSSAPAIAEYVVELLEKDGLILERKEDFNPKRISPVHFSSLTTEEKNEMIKKDPSYGHIICRCESVTEGEILAAIRQNPKATTLDGVKRRTRAGMGRCQGGFCTSFITGILARELGIPETEVKKSGGESYILVGKTK